MFGTIRRHQTWLWMIIITLTVISFVVFFSPNSKYSGQSGGGKVNLGTIKGKSISIEDFQNAQAEVYLHYFLTRGDWPDKDPMAKQLGFEPQRETYFRLLLIAKQKEYNIEASSRAVGRLAADLLHSGRENGIGSLEAFEKQVLQPHNLTASDFEHFLRHEIGNQQLATIVGMPGRLVTLDEAESLYRHENEEMSCEVAYFSASNYLASVNVNSNTLSQFHQLHQADYRIPERVQINYVKYELTNFLAEADQRLAKLTNFDLTVDAIYRQRGGTNYYREAKSPEDAKAKIKEEIRHNEALLAARKKAAVFADPLLSSDSSKPDLFLKIAETNGLAVKTAEPFSKNEEPAGLKVLPKFVRIAFELTPDSPFAGPLEGEDGVYVIGLNRRLPSENPPFDSIQDKVAADYKFTQAIELARQAGNIFTMTASNTLTSSKKFSTACSLAKAEYLKIPRFSLTTRTLPEIENRIRFGQLQNVAFTTPTGKTGELAPTEDGGFVLRVVERVPVDEKKMKQDLPGFLNFLRQTRQNEAFNEWFRKEASQELRDTPALRPATSAPAASK